MATKQISSSLISAIYNSRKVLIELLNTQNYNISEYENFSINEVNAMSSNKQLDMLLEKNGSQGKIYINYYLGKTIKQQNIQEMIDDLFNLDEILTKKDILYIIVKDDINETLTNLLKHIWEQDGIFIIIQSLKRLQFNILNHSLVPPHRIINAEEIEIVKKKYTEDVNLLPEISRFDPVSQVIFIRPGEICEIKRPSKTAIESLYYRICVNI
jgi:DNA-directed RNA polymerase subunit H (RpoH/RPB5)